MPSKCVVCKRYKNKKSAISFHRFPSSGPLLTEWLQACRLEADQPKGATVCSIHFSFDSFNEEGKLLPYAVPSPSFISTKIEKRKFMPAISSDVKKAASLSSNQSSNVVRSSDKPMIFFCSKDVVETLCSSKSVTDKPIFFTSKVPVETLSPSKNVVDQSLSSSTSKDIVETRGSLKIDEPILSTSIGKTLPSESNADKSASTAPSQNLVTILSDCLIKAASVDDTKEMPTLPRYPGDIKVPYIKNPIYAKRSLFILNETIRNQKRKISYLNIQKRNTKKQFAKIIDVVDRLVLEEEMTEEAAIEIKKCIPKLGLKITF